MSINHLVQGAAPAQRTGAALGPALRAIFNPSWFGPQLPVTLADIDLLAAKLDVGSGTHVLDLGIGTGRAAIALAKRTRCRVTGIEAHPAYIERAHAAAAAAGVANRIRFVAGDVAAPPFPTRSFDAIVSRHAFVTIADKAHLLTHCHHMLYPGGQLAATLIVNLGKLAEPPEPPTLLPWPIPTLDEYRILMRRAGLHVLAIDDTNVQFREVCARRHIALLMWANEFIGELGYDAYIRLQAVVERLALWTAEGLIGQVRLIAMR